MENNHDLDIFINVLRRAKNCDLALNILKEIRQNGLFTMNEEEIKDREWMLRIDQRKWIDFMKSKIDEAIELIEKNE